MTICFCSPYSTLQIILCPYFVLILPLLFYRSFSAHLFVKFCLSSLFQYKVFYGSSQSRRCFYLARYTPTWSRWIVRPEYVHVLLQEYLIYSCTKECGNTLIFFSLTIHAYVRVSINIYRESVKKNKKFGAYIYNFYELQGCYGIINILFSSKITETQISNISIGRLLDEWVVAYNGIRKPCY